MAVVVTTLINVQLNFRESVTLVKSNLFIVDYFENVTGWTEKTAINL